MKKLPEVRFTSTHLKLALSFFEIVGILGWLGCQSAPKEASLAQDPSQKSSKDQAAPTETLAILGTNDIHGTLAPLTLASKEAPGTPPVIYQAGGAATLASYINILKAEFGEHFIWLDAGDEFQGSVESNLQLGAPVVQFFNQNGLHAAAIGNHEFDFGIEPLKKRTSEAHYPYLAANIQEKITETLPAFPNLFADTLLQAGKLKVGIIGLSTQDTPVTTRAENVKALQFEDLKTATLRQAQSLRQRGAHIVLITAHSGLKCSPGRVSPTRLIRKPTDPQGVCGSQDEVVHLLQSLPAGTIDAVISGHSHQIVHHWIAGVPVIQAGAFGRYINVIYLTYDWNQHRVLTHQTKIEGPIPICAQIFQNQNDCNGDRPAPKDGRGPWVAHKFHGQTIEPDPKATELLAPFLATAEIEKAKILGTAVTPIAHFADRESPLGNLIADAVREVAHTDVALINPGAIRDSLSSGDIRYGDVFRVFPFDNAISVLKITGKELALILRISESGYRGFSSVSGVKLRLIEPKQDAPIEDFTGDGVDALWKMNRILTIHLLDGTPLEPEAFYTLATSDFLVTGGDNLAWAMSQIPPERIKLHSGFLVRDALVQHIQKLHQLNSESSLLVDSKNPRLQFEHHSKPVRHSKKRIRRKRNH